MFEDYLVFIVPVIIIFSITIGIVTYIKRKKALMKLAESRGWSFNNKTKEIKPLLYGFNHLYHKELDQEWHIFDRNTGGNKNNNTKTIFIIDQKKEIPNFTLRPKNKLDKMFNNNGILFDRSPEFSESYILKGEDELKIKELFNNSLSFFINNPFKKKIVCKDNSFKITYPRLSVKRIDQEYEKIRSMIRQLIRY